MKATANINLDKRRKLKGGTYPLVLRIVCNTDSRTIPLDYSIPEDAWDSDNSIVKKDSKAFKNITRVNNYLHSKQKEAQEILDKLISSGEIATLSITEIKDIVSKKEPQHSFKVFTEKIIAELKEAKKLGNADVYQQTLNFVVRLTGRKDLTFDDIDFQMIKSIESKFLSNEGNTLNGLSFYLRTVRAIYNRAIKEGKAKRDNYPFTLYSIKETKTRKRAIWICRPN